jgi:hypothetical protein
MATNNKDFKVKHGLIVEGAAGTINGQTILTEVDGDEYILDLIGGETLITSVSNEFDVTAGELSIDRTTVDAYYDPAGAAATAQGNAEDYADGLAVNYDPAGSASTAEGNANDYTDTALEDYTTTANLDTTVGGYGYLKTADLPTMYSDADAVDAISAVLGDGIEYVGGAFDVQVGTGLEIGGGTGNEIVINRTTVDAWYDPAGAASAAQTAAEGYADDAIAALVNSAPETLDTLNELAAALEDNPDIIGDLRDIAAGKQDTLTAGANIDITGATISVTGLDSGDISDFNTAALSATASAYDVAGAAAQALSDAEDYADALTTADVAEVTNLYFTDQRALDATALAYDATGTAQGIVDALDTDDIEEGSTNQYFTDVRAKTSAAQLLTGATLDNITITGDENGLVITAENGVADSDTDDLTEGTSNLYFTDVRAVDALEAVVPNFTAVEINSVAKQVAATTTVATASQVTAYEFLGTEYRSAKFLVKTAQGSHTDVSEVLLTMDASNNISITEYAMVGTNGSLMTITADYVEIGTTVRLRVTTANNTSVVTVVGTLLA